MQVDDGPWQPARLADACPSTDTWRQWVLAWTPPAAGHATACGCAPPTARAGCSRRSSAADVFPSGRDRAGTRSRCRRTVADGRSTYARHVTSRQPFTLPFGRNREPAGTSEPRFDPTSWSGALIVDRAASPPCSGSSRSSTPRTTTAGTGSASGRVRWTGCGASSPSRSCTRATGTCSRTRSRSSSIGWVLMLSGLRVFAVRHRVRRGRRRLPDLAGRAVRADHRRRQRADLRLAGLPARPCVLLPPAQVDRDRRAAAGVLRHAARQPVADRAIRECRGNRTSAVRSSASPSAWFLHPRKGGESADRRAARPYAEDVPPRPRPPPIGMIDSGVGGLTVARAVLDQLPHETLHYVGDTAQRPVRAEADRRGARARTGAHGRTRRVRRQGAGHRLQQRERGLPARRPRALRRAGGRGDPARRCGAPSPPPATDGSASSARSPRSPAARTTTRSRPRPGSRSRARPARASPSSSSAASPAAGSCSAWPSPTSRR